MLTTRLLAQKLLLAATLNACTPPVGEPGPGARDDSGDGSDPDTSDPMELDIEPGPICDTEAWPIATPWNVLAAHVVAGLADDAMIADLHRLIDGMREDNASGPWGDHVRGPLRATDGLDFGGQSPGEVIGEASVPAVTRDEDGDVWLFFVDGDLDRTIEAAESGTPLMSGIVGVGGLGAARSTDGTSFERVDITFTGDVPLYIVDPDVRALPDGTWRMTYFGVPIDQTCADRMDPVSSSTPHAAYTAVSSDLVTWNQEGVAFTPEARGSDPTVWCEDDVHCWIFMGGGGVSTDGGVTFDRTEMRVPEPGPSTPDVVGTPEGWRMYYLEGTQMVSAQSSDSINWTLEGDRAIAGADPTVMDVEGEVWMYYKQSDQN